MAATIVNIKGRPGAVRTLAVVVAFSTSAAVASPPDPVPSPSIGPDLVMSGIGTGGIAIDDGDVNGTGVTTYGTVGGVTAFSVQTVSCNIGDSPLTWFQWQALHPLFGAQLYRYSVVNGAGRFEQVGLNWLKHGFCADDFARCSLLVNPEQLPVTQPDCDGLGPFRTDIYGAALNAAQANLGARSEVNPWLSGATYPFPPVLSYGQTGDAIYKRLQVSNSELVPGDQYVMEIVGVAPGEPGPNRFNNYSHRLASLSGSTLTLSGPTRAMEPAILAWKRLDPQVRVSWVSPLGSADGRVGLASRAYQIAPGLWRYEYALFNQNFDAAVSSFAVPIVQRAVVTNAGFHDVAYHSDEVFTGEDWGVTRGAAAAAWALGADFPTSPNANALRWGTTYNFRFDCDAPPAPAPGSVTCSAFKVQAGFTLTAVTPAPPPCPGDLNHDGFTNTQDLTMLLVGFGTSVTPGCCADLNADGVVNTADLTALLAGFGCAP